MEKDMKKLYDIYERLFDEYSLIRKEMSKIFVLNAQGTLTIDNLKYLNEEYGKWHDFKKNNLDNFGRLAKETRASIKGLIRGIDLTYGATDEFRRFKENTIQQGYNNLENINYLINAINWMVEEVAVLWADIVCDIASKFCYKPRFVPATSVMNYRGGYRKIHSACIVQMCRDVAKMKKDGGIEYMPLWEALLLKRALSVKDTVGCPLVLCAEDLKAIKSLEDRNGVECKLIAWTQENCSQYIFDGTNSHTPFEELDENIVTYSNLF